MKFSKSVPKSIFYIFLLLTGVSVRAMERRPRKADPFLVAGLSKKKKKKKLRKGRKQRQRVEIEIPTETEIAQETPYTIEIFDPENQVKIRLYKTEEIIDAMKKRVKKWPSEAHSQMTIAEQEEALKTKLLSIFKGIQVNSRLTLYRVKAWFEDPLSVLKTRESRVWRDAYNKDRNATKTQKLKAADAALQKYFGITKKQIEDTERPLSQQEKWTVISHKFPKEMDKYIPAYAIYSEFESGNGPQNSFIIPGELEYIHEGFTAIKPVAFTYTFTNRGQLYHRFADQFPKDLRIQQFLKGAQQFLSKT